jgi:hypothetical protein
MKIFVEAIMDPEFSKSHHMNNLFPDNKNVTTNQDISKN